MIKLTFLIRTQVIVLTVFLIRPFVHSVVNFCFFWRLLLSMPPWHFTLQGLPGISDRLSARTYYLLRLHRCLFWQDLLPSPNPRHLPRPYYLLRLAGDTSKWGLSSLNHRWYLRMRTLLFQSQTFFSSQTFLVPIPASFWCYNCCDNYGYRCVVLEDGLVSPPLFTKVAIRVAGSPLGKSVIFLLPLFSL